MADPLRAQLEASLGDAYALGRELGGGAMSRVFVARDTALDRDVVVKVLAPALAQELSAERFTREIRLAAGLQQANIVPVLAAGATADGRPYYLMPYVAGESLRARMNQGPVAPAEAISVLRDVARALAYAHARGVVHRDVKPENVLLSSGTAVVTDFGIAKAVADSSDPDHAAAGGTAGTLTRVGMSLGTPAYMAPEQAAGDPDVGPRADLYAWGVLAYELLAGRHPFADATTPQQLLAAQLTRTPSALASTPTGRGAPRAVADVVMRCLAKEPADRPASAAALVTALDGGAVSPHGRSAPRARRVVAGGLALAALAAAVVAWRGHHTPNAGGPFDVAPVAASTAPLLLAVLPFDNAGPADQAVFTDGLTDAVTAKLGALPGLAVIDRRSAAQYRQTTKPARQIGAELGVRYLVEGVVQWAKDPAGAWRAQVTPSLVDARTGTTAWTGDPVVITPADPFTAQARIATTVAEALQVALRPGDRERLARRPAGNPQAFAAYVRGRAFLDGIGQDGFAQAPDELRRASAEFTRAVALDSAFGPAWGSLLNTTLLPVAFAGGDRAAAARLRATLAAAEAHAPNDPTVLAARGQVRLVLDHDTAGGSTLIDRAVAAAPNDAQILRSASGNLWLRRQYDSAYALAARAATLDPRSALVLATGALYAQALRRWADARRYADAVIALDSTDERGWRARVSIALAQGDTLAAQRAAAQALARLPRPSGDLLHDVAYAGGSYAAQYLARSPGELGLAWRGDSVGYYDTKADLMLRRGDLPRARAYADSVRRLVLARPLDNTERGFFTFRLAFAQALLGDTAAARATIAPALGRMPVGGAPLGPRPSVRHLAGAYAQIGDADAAVRVLAAELADPAGGITARGFAIDPKLLVLRGMPAFERFMRSQGA